MLVADIGGGTSDFSLVCVGPERARHLERKGDVLAYHGVHVAGTDFDRRVELMTILRELGYQTLDPQGREVPNRVYFDLATWHLINTVYTPKRVSELQLIHHLYPDTHFHDRLMRVVDRRLGHALTAHAGGIRRPAGQSSAWLGYYLCLVRICIIRQSAFRAENEKPRLGGVSREL